MSPHLQDTLDMFAFLAIELSALFIGISLLVGMLQRHIPPAKVAALLSANGSRGYFLAAGLGAITPFCSCSTIPMLKGLIRARAGFGPMMVFLFSSPLLNPIVVGLLVVTFGWTLTAIYVLAALIVSLAAGVLLQQLGFERYVRSSTALQHSECGSSVSPCDTVASESSCAPNRCASTATITADAATEQTAASSSGGSAGASLTELILLRALFTLKLLAAFVAVIFAMAMLAGYATYLLF